ncbi:hypothetical protein ARMSODRAFT_949766 [Armillaria solidipes]|uniref:Uncharacterized protein n=1 Tax=Armillaria solidipes TaxID=1076256 RepID=A0A2H3BX94_9AGAR|nr:hypothetical protein ARMSODRAFT_949766 [Armillaria solidipes]
MSLFTSAQLGGQIRPIGDVTDRERVRRIVYDWYHTLLVVSGHLSGYMGKWGWIYVGFVGLEALRVMKVTRCR